MRVDYLVGEVKDHFLKYPDIKILLQSAKSSWFGHLDFSNTLKKTLSSAGREYRKLRSASLNSKIEAAESSSFGLR